MATQIAYIIGEGDGDIGVNISVCDDCDKQLWENTSVLLRKGNELCFDCYLEKYAVKAKCSKCGANNEDEWLYSENGKLYCTECRPSLATPKAVCSKCGADNGCGYDEKLYDNNGEILCYYCMAKELEIEP